MNIIFDMRGRKGRKFQSGLVGARDLYIFFIFNLLKDTPGQLK